MYLYYHQGNWIMSIDSSVLYIYLHICVATTIRILQTQIIFHFVNTPRYKWNSNERPSERESRVSATTLLVLVVNSSFAQKKKIIFSLFINILYFSFISWRPHYRTWLSCYLFCREQSWSLESYSYF